MQGTIIGGHGGVSGPVTGGAIPVASVRPAIVLILAFTIITGLVYPLVMTGIAGVIFPHQAHGSLIERDGKVIGSKLMGAIPLVRPLFPWPPLSHAWPNPSDPSKTTPVPYNTANSMGSNLGPTNKALIDRVKADVDKL